MEQNIPQEIVRRIIINDMVKKRNSIVPVIGEDTIVYSLSVPFVLFGLSYRVLKWILSTIKEGSKVLLRYTLLKNIGSLLHETCLLAQRTYVHEAMNMESVINYIYEI